MALSTSRTVITQSGLTTTQSFNVGGILAGTSNLHTAGIEVAGINVLGADTPIGTGSTIYDDGGARFSGIVSATKFVGDISDATGAAAGLGTALSQTQTDPHNKIYFTNKVLSISTTTTIDHPATANLAYTQYGDIKIENGHDLVIKDGDDFKYDILGISTTKIPNNQFPSGLSGDLTGNVTGNVTGNADTASNLSGNPSINTTGTITATSFSGDGGSITGVNSPVFYGKQGTSQNIAHATYTTITNLTSTSINVGGGFDTASGVFTVPAGKGGTYFLHGGAGIDDVQNNDYVQVTFMKNGSRVGPYARTWAPDQNDQIIDANLTTIMNLSAGDTVNFQVYHTGNATEPTEENRCFFGGYRLAV